MKKIFRLLLLGFLTVTVLSPSVVNAEENQHVQNNNSSLYREIDRNVLRTTPYTEEITLNPRESYDLTTQLVIFPTETEIPSFWFIKIKPPYDDYEVFSYQPLANLHGYIELLDFPRVDRANKNFPRRKQYWSSDYDFLVSDQPIIYDVGVRITNLSPTTITYSASIMASYNEDDDDYWWDY